MAEKDWERLGGAPTGRRDCGTTRQRDDGAAKKTRASPAISRRPEVPSSRKKNSAILRRSQPFPGVLRRSQPRVAVRCRAWLIREFREIGEFRDVRAMPATNQVSDVVPLNRAARSLTSLNSLISLNSLLTARYHHAPKRGSLTSEGLQMCSIAKESAVG